MLLTEEVKVDAYPQLNFEGTPGSAEVNNQNAYWENRNTQAIDVANVRSTVSMNTGQTYAMLTRKSTGSIGATKFLKVMAGKINVHVKTKRDANASLFVFLVSSIQHN